MILEIGIDNCGNREEKKTTNWWERYEKNIIEMKTLWVGGEQTAN